MKYSIVHKYHKPTKAKKKSIMKNFQFPMMLVSKIRNINFFIFGTFWKIFLGRNLRILRMNIIWVWRTNIFMQQFFYTCISNAQF